MLLNDSDAVYIGSQAADKAYLGTTQVWPTGPTGPGGFNPFSFGSPAHGYWAEGPAFQALNVVDGANVVSMPDEVGSVAAAAPGSNPSFAPFFDEDGFNGKPSLNFTGSRWLATAAWTAMTQPNMVVIVYQYTTAVFGTLFDGIASGNRNALTVTGGNYWLYAGTGVLTDGAPDTGLHVAIATFDSTDLLEIDGAGRVSGNAGAHSLTGLTFPAVWNGGSPSVVQVPLVIVYDTPLTDPEKTDLLAAIQAHYGTATSATFATKTNSTQTFVVPPGVTELQVDMGGGRGGFSGSSGVTNGGRIQTTLAVTPGETLHLRVGTDGGGAANNGGTGGGFFGGAGGGSGLVWGGGGGGGASDIRQGGTALTDRVVVAGGSGGGANNGISGGSGGFALDTQGTTPNNASAGTSTGLANGGGGGGGGWRGGGGGAAQQPGGGGSNMHNTTVCSDTTSTPLGSTGGYITLTW